MPFGYATSPLEEWYQVCRVLFMVQENATEDRTYSGSWGTRATLSDAGEPYQNMNIDKQLELLDSYRKLVEEQGNLIEGMELYR